MNEDPTECEKKFYEWCEQRGKKIEENADKLCDMSEEEFWKYIDEINRGKIATIKRVQIEEKLKRMKEDFE
jgi:hypothetical protein